MATEIEYQGLYFNTETDPKVMQIIAENIGTENRLRFFLGMDKKYWLEEYDTIGRIGKSTGVTPIPLLIQTSRSLGGTGILTHCVQMITIDKQIVYQHPEFEIKKFKIVEAISVDLPCSVKYDESIVANFTTKDKAERWIRFMKGETNHK